MRRADRLAFASLFACAAVFANEAAAPPADEEMLEFLGEFATDDGGWLDPQALSDAGMLERADLESPETANEGHDNDESL